jgi:hypothetical protein
VNLIGLKQQLAALGTMNSRLSTKEWSLGYLFLGFAYGDLAGAAEDEVISTNGFRERIG